MEKVNGTVVVLEPSTNTHVMKNSNGGFEVKDYEGGKMKIVNNGSRAIVEHGEHGTLGIESKVSMKHVQKEYNPITKKMQNAWD